MVDQLNFQEDLAIDPLNLDEEWLLHPVKYLKYCDAQTDAQRDRDKSKERLEVARAEVDMDVRKNPSDYGHEGDKKPTEAQITSMVYLSEKYQKALNEFNDLNYEYNMISNAVKAFEHRKKALENYVTLYVTQYVAGPKQPKVVKEGKRMVENIRKTTAINQRQAMNEKRRARQAAEQDGDGEPSEKDSGKRRTRSRRNS